ncbi:hypothetical protein N7532_000134 [Penicillium argentinense]|uniref:Uncharacterized protein n=1 Tax=Penicillium argentinense TaxID=1131581 RepID=A0A9W9G4L8_9EURO|nr:uncharacterized protein N7532_000134 [Penicillium argentinense]KAJ5112089.1 hypothetical protein N7532_000134 [Penicillium argentinense]
MGHSPVEPPQSASDKPTGQLQSNDSSPGSSLAALPRVAGQQQTDEANGDSVSSPHPPRKFLPQPVETSSRSSHIPNSKNSTDPSSPKEASQDVRPRRRLLPEPVETTKTSHRGSSIGKQKITPHVSSTVPRRFKPEIIETEYRSAQGTPARYARLRGDRPDAPGRASRLSPNRGIFDPSESKFSYANLLRRHELRRHSFRVPDLPSIPSNSSEDSDASSESPSSSSAPEKLVDLHPELRRDGQLFQESRQGGLSEYLLQLAARSAHQQLKDQTLAAFPNEQNYQPVDHFAIDEETRDSEEEDCIYPPKHHIKSRRQSSADLSWELEYMRQHKEEAEQRLRIMASSRKPDLKPSVQRSGERPGPNPPMLGDDIIIPQSLSPQGTFSETVSAESGTQAESDPCTGCGGLWCGPTRPGGGGEMGLWMGTCRKDEGHDRETQTLSGIMTPMALDDEPGMSPSPSHTSRVARKDWADQPTPRSIPTNPSKSLEDEFHDGFVTQIYNYISLGYPCVARYYDHELSRISGIHVDDLRRDDLHTNAKGYVMAPEDDLTAACTRWKALRLYIREWARQQPSMAEDDTFEAWGVPERRGSWAI